MKTKKIKGGFTPFISNDEKILSTAGKSIAYVYNIEEGKLLTSIRTLNNISRTAISSNKQLLAVKNTSGTLVIYNIESGEKLCQSYMECREGEQMIFVSDDSAVLDFDRDGRTMLFDYSTGKHSILDGPAHGIQKQLPRTSYIRYDAHTNRIYKFMADNYGESSGKIMVSPADTENIAFETVNEMELIPDYLHGISLCKTHNYHMDTKTNQLIVTDKDFSEISRIELPSGIGIRNAETFRVSAGEKYIFLDFGQQCDYRDFAASKTAKNLSCLFTLDSMEKVAEFDYPYFSDFVMFDDDKRFVLSTWKESYLGTL